MSITKNILGKAGSRFRYVIAAAMLLFVMGQAVSYAQKPKKGKKIFTQAVEYKKDSVVLSDSLRAIRDSLHRADSLFKVVIVVAELRIRVH
ncbi:MAG: hypothetical protein II466_02285, partial [Bacteroidales bacterium]|nr:hypothetical protein [Bacteroidales bacterium]